MNSTLAQTHRRCRWSVSKRKLLGLIALLGVLPVGHVEAFSLLGPNSEWMDLEKGYRKPHDIGGPMNLGEGYRWNIPVITYGFDRSFLDYFGTNGVAAVEGAIAVLNGVPSASQVNLEATSTNVLGQNWKASALFLIDLKTQTLALLLEEMGLADSTRYCFCIRDFLRDSGSNYVFFVIQRSFDPATAQPSAYVNGELLSYQVVQHQPTPSATNVFCETAPFEVDPTSGGFWPVASLATEWAVSPYGMFATNLTRDDIGGLSYLLSGERIFAESLLPDIHLADSNTGPLVVTAYRPGVEKLTFIRHPAGPANGAFLPFTNRWLDVYLDSYGPAYQNVERVTTRPDILFTAQDLGPSTAWNITGTSNWANNADLNGNLGGAGPGVIQPPVTIAFNDGGPFYAAPSDASDRNSVPVFLWGSFDGTTNLPVVYPEAQALFAPTQVHFRLLLGGLARDFHWPLAGPAYGRFLLQTTTNLSSWATLATLTNSGAPFQYQFQGGTSESARFFRTVPQF